MPNFSSLARLEVPEKFVWGVGWGVGWGGVVCKVIFVSNQLRLSRGVDNFPYPALHAFIVSFLKFQINRTKGFDTIII